MHKKKCIIFCVDNLAFPNSPLAAKPTGSFSLKLVSSQEDLIQLFLSWSLLVPKFCKKSNHAPFRGITKPIWYTNYSYQQTPQVRGHFQYYHI